MAELKGMIKKKPNEGEWIENGRECATPDMQLLEHWKVPAIHSKNKTCFRK